MNKQAFVKLGLTPDEVKLYLLLLNKGMLRSTWISTYMDKHLSAVSRLAKRLEEKGFIIISRGRPPFYQPVPPEIAVDLWVGSQHRELEKFKLRSIEESRKVIKKDRETVVQVLSSKEMTYQKFIEFSYKTNSEILVMSIGEPISDDIKLAHLQAIKRGVSIKLLVSKYDSENENLLKSWLKMGTSVKHYKDSGYHLMLFDSKKSILVANNPDNTEEQTGMIINSQGLTSALRSFFYQRWEEAEDIRF